MKSWMRKAALCAMVGLVLVLTTMSVRPAAGRSLGALQAVFLNVGQGDAELLRDGSGFNVLIDGGEIDAGPAVVAYLRDHGVSDIDVMVASHPDSDHIGGLIDVLEATDIPVGAVIYNGYPGSTQTWTDFTGAAEARGLTPSAAQFPAVYTWGEMTVHVLNPAAGLADPETNDASIVLLVDHGEVNFLLTGDISSAVEAQVLARGTPMAAEVLKVAHHGSAGSSSSAFLSAVGPRDSIIEVGENDYGHPAAETLQRLAGAGSAVWRTDLNGNVLVASDGVTYTISAEAVWRVLLPLAMNGWAHTVPTAGDIRVVSIFADGEVGSAEPDEYVEIQNVGGQATSVQNWTLRDNSGKVFTFPAFTMQPNQACRVYTNENHAEWCGFNYGSGSAIWNNGGDCAFLRNAQGEEVSKKCYP